MSYTYFDDDIGRANASTDQALQLARKIGYKEGEGWALVYRGLYYFFNGVLPEARTNFDKALSLGKALGDVNLQAYALTQLGNVYRDGGGFDSALLYYKQAESEIQQKPDRFYQSVIKVNKGRYYLIIDALDSARTSITEALELRKSLRKASLLADPWILLGNYFRNKYDLKEAIRYYSMAREVAPKDPSVNIDYLQNMGEVYFRQGDFQMALKNWSEVLSYHRNIHYKYGLASLLLRMGEVFEEQGYYDLAIEYLSNSLNTSQKSQYNFLAAEAYYELAWVFYRANNLDLANKNILQAEQVYGLMNYELGLAGCLNVKGLIQMKKLNYDSSLYYHQKSLERRLRNGNEVAISSSLFNLGELYLAQKQFKIALTYFIRGKKIDDVIGDNYGLSLYNNRIGRIYTQLGVFDSAKLYLEKSMSLAAPSLSSDILHVDYNDMADYYHKIGKQEEAINLYKKVNQLADSIFNKQTAQSLASYRTLYDVERNEQKIELLNKDNLLNKAQVETQKAILYSVAGGAIILLGLVAFYFRFSRRLKKLNYALAGKNREISEKNEEIQAQAEELTENNQVITDINERLEERIEERTSELKQAFKELDTFFYRSSHDFRRPLTTFMGLAEVAKVLVKDPAALELFEKVNENALMLDKMLRKLQSMSDADTQTLIYRDVDIKEMFETELNILKPELDKKGIRTIVTVKLERSFRTYGALVAIILQNLLENAITFCTGKSPLIRLSAHENRNEVIIEIEDNGQGIDPIYLDRVFEMYFRANEHSKGNGLGLYIVKKIVQKLNGRVELESIPGVSTIVRVFLPNQLD